MTGPWASVIGSVLVFAAAVAALLERRRSKSTRGTPPPAAQSEIVPVMRFSLLLSDELDDTRAELAKCRARTKQLQRRIRTLERAQRSR